MAAMIGKWVCCPELTTGFEELHQAMGSSEEERKKKAGVAYTCDMSRDGDTWHMVINYPGNAAFSRTYDFKSGVETEYPGSEPGHMIKTVVDVGDNAMKTSMKKLVHGELKKEIETAASMEGDYLVFKIKCQGKEMVEKMKRCI